MKGTNLGEFEELVLLVCCVLHGEAYGVAIQEEVARQTGRSVSISAVHTTLHRLEEKGYLASRMGGATAERGGRRKRLFEITSAGKASLLEARALRDQLWRRIPEVVFQGGAG